MKSLKPKTTLKAGEEIIRFDNVVVRYGKDNNDETLKHLTFNVDHGSFHFLMGPSGAGKSTLLKLLYLGLRPTQGMVRIFGEDVYKLPRSKLAILRRQIGVVFQDFRLINHLNVLDNVALPLRIAGVKKEKIQKDVTDLLKWVGLGKKLSVLPSTLSGGEQQRVAIARAVVSKPALLLADEPTGNVDDEMAKRLLHLFEELNKTGTTVIIATHNDHLVRTFKHPVIRLERGQLNA